MNTRFDFRNLLNNVSLSETSEYQKIYYLDLIPDENNPYSLENIEELADTIETCGLLEPLVVKTAESGKYIIVSGHRRHAAISFLIEKRKLSRFENIPCIVLSEDTEEPMTRIMLHVANTTQRTLTVAETLHAVSDLKKLYKECEAKGIHLKGKIRDQIAADIHIAPRQAQKYMTIDENADEDTISALKAGNLTVKEAYEKVKKSRVNKTFSPVQKLSSVSKQLQRINSCLKNDRIEIAIEILNTEITIYEKENAISSNNYR